jgi:protein arginine kinase
MERLFCHWVREAGEQGDVVFSARVRLARNLCGIPFPRNAGAAYLDQILKETAQAAEASPHPLGMISLENLSPIDRLVLVEKHLISPQHADHPQHRAVLLDADETVSIMVNEEDHLRIQTILPGFQLAAAWRLTDEIDDFLESRLEYAFDEMRGYLTACPTNVGTGIRASVMLHLPALIIIDQARKVLSALAHLGFNVRGLYGEGSEAHGAIFQISNQVTLGQAEEEIINTLSSATRQVIDHERGAREALLRESKVQLEDRLSRSYGLLTNCRLLTSDEALRLLSDLKLGMDVGLFPTPPRAAKELLLLTRTGILQKLADKELESTERDFYRAAVVREWLSA